ncbi:ATP-binding protein [Sphingomonas montana]|uniref:ATP-binding protein n=1 Tax=Sphingomonas montana TaxID=1843236 RepID=UPI00101AE620|nr:ATP-binding protein [Sphingomonas montana]
MDMSMGGLGGPAFRTAQPVVDGPVDLPEIGQLRDVAGAGTRIVLDAALIGRLALDPDPATAAAGQVGSLVKMVVANRWLIANVRSMMVSERDADRIVADIDFLGEADHDAASGAIRNFRRGITRYPVPGARIFPLSGHDMRQVFATDDRAHVEVGTIYPTTDVRGALFIDALLGKHFAVLGSTGTGKSTATALILHRICERMPEGHIVMIDPHGEYSAAFNATGEIFDVGNLAMPYWLMNFEEHTEVLVTSRGADRQVDMAILAKCLLAARLKNRLAETIPRLTVDSPVPYLLSDLSNMIQTEMGRMDKATDSAPYLRLKSKIDEIKADPRYAFMFSGMLVGDTMAPFLAKLFRLPGGGRPISIIDVSGVPSDITAVVVAVISRMVFDYAIWARGEAQRPVLLVCEEAHRYIPADRTGGGQAVRKVLERIAKEGRKYGVSLGLVTQRPSDLAEGVLSQCGTLISMRLNNDRDQAFVKAAMPEGARGFLDSIPSLRNREAIICGEGVAIPIRVQLDDLEPEKRPASNDPAFSVLWRESGGEDAILTRVVRRWRNQGR